MLFSEKLHKNEINNVKFRDIFWKITLPGEKFNQLCNIMFITRFMIAHDQVQLGEVLGRLHHPNSEDRSPSHPAYRHIWVTLGWYLDGVWLIWLCAILTPYFPDIENSITHLYENLLKSFRITCCCCCCFGSSEKKGAVHYRWRFLQHIILKRRMEYQKHQYILTHWNKTIYISKR